MVARPSCDYRPLSRERRAEILTGVLTRAPDPGCIRVFAYGSLMWNPCFAPEASEPATLNGYSRSFCILTVRARGTPECPGLGPALVPGDGACRGIAYRLDPRTLDKDLEALFEREMNTGVYRPTWLEAEGAEGRRFTVLSFVVDPDHPQYAGGLTLAEKVELIDGACGTFGSCRDYLASMVAEIRRLGAVEPEFETLLAQVDARGAEGAGVRRD